MCTCLCPSRCVGWIPASFTFSICASHSCSASRTVTSRLAIRNSNASGPPANSPSSFSNVATSSRGAVGSPSLRFRCTPTPSPGVDRASSTPEANATPFASSEVLVTMPFRCASAIPRLTPSVQPKSSAFTMRFFNVPYVSLGDLLSFWPATHSCALGRRYH